MADEAANQDDAAANQPGGVPPVPEPGDGHSARTWPKILLALGLGVATVVAICFLIYEGKRVAPGDEFRVKWEAPPGVTVEVGPDFGYEAGQLIHRGPINEARQTELLGKILINGKKPDTEDVDTGGAGEEPGAEPGGEPGAELKPGAEAKPGPEPRTDSAAEPAGAQPAASPDPSLETGSEESMRKESETDPSTSESAGKDDRKLSTDETAAATASYRAAVRQLTFVSNRRAFSGVMSLFLLGGLAGFVGAQTRSIQRFIHHGCYKNDLDVKRFWPWYVMRPVLGFILGGFLIVLVQGGYLSTQPTSTGALAWLGLCYLGGFGIKELLEKLRDVTRTTFGKRDDDS